MRERANRQLPSLEALVIFGSGVVGPVGSSPTVDYTQYPQPQSPHTEPSFWTIVPPTLVMSRRYPDSTQHRPPRATILPVQVTNKRPRTDSRTNTLSQWTESEDNDVIKPRGQVMTWGDVSKQLPARTADSCRVPIWRGRSEEVRRMQTSDPINYSLSTYYYFQFVYHRLLLIIVAD